MRYEGVIYRPPSEFDSLIIQATIGCPHNKCSFCNMYKDRKFKIRSINHIKKDLEYAKDIYGEELEKIFFSDGNTILMKTKDLLDILSYAKSLFPNLKRATMYGSAQYINLKSLEELKELRNHGLTRIHCGMESGDDEVLGKIHKGYTGNEMIKAGKLIKNAGIELSLYYIVGLGGRELFSNHAINSAKVINEIKPDFVRLRTLMPRMGTELYEEYKRGDFQLLNPHEALEETKVLINNINEINTCLVSDHISNYWNIEGLLLRDKKSMIEEIDYALSLDSSNFRNPESGSL
ncbi:radical SAM protein [Anaeromicrobium sediminis]|uniref:Radical SAM protein n=1 Tax=Anaeromicrobium sediminis TaxID=1478221 RepID=A0A267MPN6_9FIRM|nr:radical SAM protein [Anaeromicrobium sediminis]